MSRASRPQGRRRAVSPGTSGPDCPQRRLEDRLQFEALLTEISDRFVNLPADQVDAAVEDAQRLICERLDLSVSSLYQLSRDDSRYLGLTHRHLRGDSPPLTEVWDGNQRFPWAMEKLLRGEAIVLSRLADAPPEGAHDVEIIGRHGVRSYLGLPLSVGGSPPFGTLGFHVVGREQEWTTDLVVRLKLVAQVFANALARKRDRRALRESEEKLLLTTSAANLGLWVLDTAGTTFWGNAKLFELLGLSGMDFLDIGGVAARVHPEDRDRFLEVIAQARCSAEMSQLDCRIALPDGSVRWLHFRGRLYASAAGGAAQLMGIAGDVTERKNLEERVRQALEEVQLLRDRLHVENVYLREQLRRDDGHERIVGESEAVLKMLAQAKRVAPMDTTVLITGETGTGKELLARAIHEMSGRSSKVMVTVNCAALPPALIESELFGREKGAYTGALTRQAGRFEMANGTSLFLDEIGDLPPEIQVKLLRVLQDGQFERLGSTRTQTVDVRVIAATNRDLSAMVRDGRFRADLFHRLNVYPIEVPPLRARDSDVPLLVWKFVQEFNKKMGKSIDSIPRKAMERLKHCPWAGNVRELRNLIERAMIVSDGRSLTVDLPAGAPARSSTVPVTLEEVERTHIREVLESVHWRISGEGGAAEILGVRPTTLHSRMKKLGISRQ
jgi:formate hydrogenlyase transcriptional activator